MQTQSVASHSHSHQTTGSSSTASTSSKAAQKNAHIDNFLRRNIVHKSAQEHRDLLMVANQTLAELKKEKKKGHKLSKEENAQFNTAQELVKSQKKEITVKVEGASFQLLPPPEAQEKSSWIKKGEYISHPLYVEKMKITENFLETTLGKKLLGITKEYLNKSHQSTTAKKWLLKQDFTDGTCLGQSYTLLCVLMKYLKDNANQITDKEFAEHVLFFQTLEDLRVSWPQWQEVLGALFGATKVINPPEKLIIDELGKFGLYRGQKHAFKAQETAQIRDVLQDKSVKAIEIGMTMTGESESHSICAFFGSDQILLYDPQTGFIAYSKRDDFISDIFRYIKDFEAKQSQKGDSLKFIQINCFTERRVQRESSGSGSVFQSLLDLSKEALLSI